MKTRTQTLLPPNHLEPVLHTAIAGLWLLLFWPSLSWLFTMYGQQDNLLNRVLFFFILLYLAHRFAQRPAVELRFYFKTAPAVFLVAGIGSYLFIERFVGLNILSCMAFGLATFGLAGLYLPVASWLRSAPAFLLLILTLPFGQHLEVFFGFPLRLLSAQTIQSAFAALGVDSFSRESILLIENRMTHIDLPCSGVKSLWTACIFYLFLTVMEGYRLGVRWLTGLIALLSLVVCANMVRIFLLVSLSHGEFPDTLGQSVHIPLGLSGFALACGIVAYFGSRWISRFSKEPPVFGHPSCPAQGLVLLLILGISLWAHEQRLPDPAGPANRPLLSFPGAQPLPLTRQETQFFSEQSGAATQKLRFEYRGLSGTLFLVQSANWRAHHHPEQCVEGQGHAVGHSRTRFIDREFPYRLVALRQGGYRAVYWFHSQGRVTDDYTARTWSGIREPGREWTMVTLYFDRNVAHKLDEVDRLQRFIRDQLDSKSQPETLEIPL